MAAKRKPKLTGLMIDYHFKKASPAVEEKWSIFVKQFWEALGTGRAGAGRVRAGKTVKTGSGSGGGHADFSVDTSDPAKVKALVKRLAKSLRMRVSVTEMEDRAAPVKAKKRAAKTKTAAAAKGKRVCGSKTGGTRVQSLAFSKTKHARSKPKWTAARARKWAEQHGYKATKVDEKPSEYRLRQFAPGACEYRSVPFGSSGVRGIVETPHVKRMVDEELVRR